MTGFGFGFRSNHRANVHSVPIITPAINWTGAAGSGFVTTPVDPIRNTAKPAMRLLTPPNQYFVDEILVGVIAGANNHGSLHDNLGLENVIVHYEGSTALIEEPSLQTFKDANGVPRTYLGWWVKLKRIGSGYANIYFEAIPKDTTMQHRVIGPYQFAPQAVLHDYSLEIAGSKPQIAGSRYQTTAAAMTYLASKQANNPLLTITEAGTYDLGAISAIYEGQGYCTIKATVPITLAKGGFTTDAAAIMRPRYDGLHIVGANITIDFNLILVLYHENPTGRQHWLDGINIINSAGRYALWRAGARPLSNIIRDNPWLTECDISQVPTPCVGASLVRGCNLHGGFNDVVTDAACVVNTTTSDWDSSDNWARDVPSLTVAYSGPETSATIAISGANDATSRTITATWGANSAIFVTGSTEAVKTAGKYYVSDVAAWLIGLGVGFSATVLNNTRRAAALALSGQKGAPFTARDVKSEPLTLVTMFDVHTDWYQQNSSGMAENCVMANNASTGLVAQDIFVIATIGAKDFLIFNNAFDNKLAFSQYDNNAFLSSQLGRVQSHVVLAHNTWASQGMLFRGDQAYAPDQYCLFANNAIRDLTWTGAVAGQGVIANNHLQSGAAGLAIGTGNTAGGVQTESFADSANGKFGVRGALRSDQRVPIIPFDRLGKRRAPMDAAGAEAIGAVAIVAPTAPAFGSISFPPFNRQYQGIGASIAFPSNNVTQTPLLRFDNRSAFFVMLQVPHERSNLNREYRVIGNAIGSAASSFSLVHHGDDYFTTNLHDEFRWRSRGASGDGLDLTVDVQTRADKWQLIVVRCDGSGNYSITSYAAGEAKISGSVQTSTTHAVDTLTGSFVTLADAENALGSLATLAEPYAGFDGSVAFHGFVTGDAGDDARWQAIAEGADIVSTLSSATGFKLLRDYRKISTPTDGMTAYASGDTTSPGIIQGTVGLGGTISRQGASKFLNFDRLPDGYVVCPGDGQDRGQIALSGTSTGLSGNLYARILSNDGTTLVPPFLIGTAASAMSIMMTVPPFTGWGYLEIWAESSPDIAFRMNSRLGCGDKVAVIGEAPGDALLYSSGLIVAPTGTASFCGYFGTRSDPADTLLSPMPRVNLAARPQLFVIEPQMTAVFNGVTAIAERIGQYNGGKAICVIDGCIADTSARDWINDGASPRQWASDVEVANLAGKDRVPVWQWYKGDIGYDYGQVLDAVVLGTGPYAANHTLFDGSIQANGFKLGICLPGRMTSSTPGSLDSDDLGASRTYAQAGQIAWCETHSDIAVVGPAASDMALNGADGFIESLTRREGAYRLGYRIGETYLRARSLSPSAHNAYLDPAQIDINTSRTSITIRCVLPNAGSGLRTHDGRAVTGFELSTDAGATWTRSGFVATIVDDQTVQLNKSSGAWPPNVRLTYLRGGPFSYGTAQESFEHYKGSLYDGCEADGGLGLPVLGIAGPNGITI